MNSYLLKTMKKAVTEVAALVYKMTIINIMVLKTHGSVYHSRDIGDL